MTTQSHILKFLLGDGGEGRLTIAVYLRKVIWMRRHFSKDQHRGRYRMRIFDYQRIMLHHPYHNKY